MKLFSSLLLSLSTLAFCLPGQAQTSNEEDLLVATEVPRIVVNYAPNGVIAGRAILYNCDTCEPEQVEFTADTELLIDGQPRPLTEFARKVDWSGVVSVMSRSPNRVIQFSLH